MLLLPGIFRAYPCFFQRSWWRHQMETFSALLAICAGNSPVSGEFPAQRPVTRGFDVFFDLCLNKRLSKQSWGWWLETQSCSLWRHSNVKTDLWSCQFYKVVTPTLIHPSSTDHTVSVNWKDIHYNDVIMTTIASQITSLTIVYPTVYSDADQR